MTRDDSYFRYLRGRSRLGLLYRRGWLYPQLARRLAGRTLDVGCGIGDMLAYRSATVGVDIDPHTVAHCRSRGLDARLMEVDRLPFDAATFDSVLLDNVLEHVAEPAPLLAEVHRVLVPRGRLLVGVPGTKGWHTDPDHKVHYDERSLAALAAQSGFAARETFHTPAVRSDWLSRRLRQYCLYMLFERAAAPLEAAATVVAR